MQKFFFTDCMGLALSVSVTAQIGLEFVKETIKRVQINLLYIVNKRSIDSMIQHHQRDMNYSVKNVPWGKSGFSKNNRKLE